LQGSDLRCGHSVPRDRALASFSALIGIRQVELRFMPRPRISTEMRPSMPAGKRWPCLNAADLGRTWRRLAAAALRNADRGDAIIHAGCHVSHAEPSDPASCVRGWPVQLTALELGSEAGPQVAGRRASFGRPTGWTADAASAFAKCRHDVAHALCRDGPQPASRAAKKIGDLRPKARHTAPTAIG